MIRLPSVAPSRDTAFVKPALKHVVTKKVEPNYKIAGTPSSTAPKDTVHLSSKQPPPGKIETGVSDLGKVAKNLKDDKTTKIKRITTAPSAVSFPSKTIDRLSKRDYNQIADDVSQMVLKDIDKTLVGGTQVPSKQTDAVQKKAPVSDIELPSASTHQTKPLSAADQTKVANLIQKYESQKDNDPKKALESINQALKIDPNNAQLMLKKGQILPKANPHDQDSDLKALRDQHAKAKKTDRTKAVDIAYKYNQLLFQKQMDTAEKAERLVRKAKDLDPKLDITQSLNDIQDEKKRINEFVQISAKGYLNWDEDAKKRSEVNDLIKTYESQKDKEPRKALASINQALKIDPNNAQLHLKKGQILTQGNPHYQDADLKALREQHAKAKKSDPAQAKSIAYKHNATLYEREVNTADQAIKAIKKAKALDPKLDISQDLKNITEYKAEKLKWLALQQQRLGHPEKALKAINQSLKLNPHDSNSYYRKSQILLENKLHYNAPDLKTLRDQHAKVKKSDSAQVKAIALKHNRLFFERQLDGIDEAKHLLRKANQLNPNLDIREDLKRIEAKQSHVNASVVVVGQSLLKE